MLKIITVSDKMVDEMFPLAKKAPTPCFTYENRMFCVVTGKFRDKDVMIKDLNNSDHFIYGMNSEDGFVIHNEDLPYIEPYIDEHRTSKAFQELNNYLKTINDYLKTIYDDASINIRREVSWVCRYATVTSAF